MNALATALTEAGVVAPKARGRSNPNPAPAPAPAPAPTEVQVHFAPTLVVDNGPAPAPEPAWVTDPVRYILTRSADMELVQTDIHLALCVLMGSLSVQSGASIAKDENLARLFSHDFKGDTRARIARWLGDWSPIRVKFHANGVFDKVTFSSNERDRAVKAGRPVFDLEGAKENPWYETGKARTKKASAPAMEGILKSLTWQVARIAYAEGLSLADVIDSLVKLAEPQGTESEPKPSKLAAAAGTYVQSDKFRTWATEYDLIQALKEREEASKPKPRVNLH